jgi:hypothetical protein
MANSKRKWLANFLVFEYLKDRRENRQATVDLHRYINIDAQAISFSNYIFFMEWTGVVSGC